MGKKSRSSKKSKAANNGHSRVPLVSDINSNLSASSFTPPSFAAELPQPAEGWARELRKLEKELRDTHYQDAAIVLSAAKAARIMRQFDVLEKILTKAESKGVEIEDQKLWAQLNEDVAALKRVKTSVRSDSMKQIINGVMKEGMNVDKVAFEDSTFIGMNCLQFAATRGDVQLMEQFIKMGAALDFEASEMPYFSGIVQKPKECTALLLAVNGAITTRNVMSVVARGGMGGMGGRFGGGEARETYEGCVECAIQLVRLGADTSVTFQFPPGCENHPIYQTWHVWKLEGKSVRDVASLVGSDLFEKTVEEFSKMEHQIEHVNCRCGSRLPWKLCHAGKPTDPYYLADKNDEKGVSKVKWRYSPLAPCHCSTSHSRLGDPAETKKIHFKCCWDETAHREYYQCDKTSEIRVMARMANTPFHREALNSMNKIMQGKSEEEISKYMENAQQMMNDPEVVIASRCKIIREGGSLGMQTIVTGDNPCSKLCSWDSEVYAGIMETMDPDLSFCWKDVHWTLPKAELLKRVSEWNEALEQYCDNIGLNGSEREDVIKLHTASEYAPCGNGNCDKMETSVKQFKKCSRCFSVAYCSPACQKADWKYHKKNWCRPGTRERQTDGTPAGRTLQEMLANFG